MNEDEVRLTPQGRDEALQVLMTHLFTLPAEQALTIISDPKNHIPSPEDLVKILFIQRAMDTEMRDQAWFKQQMDQIVARLGPWP